MKTLIYLGAAVALWLCFSRKCGCSAEAMPKSTTAEKPDVKSGMQAQPGQRADQVQMNACQARRAGLVN